jgi:flagellar protein FliS
MSVLTRRGIAKYSRVAVESELSSASPHRLVQMLFQGALDKLAIAKGHVERKEFSKKSEHISWAISIIGGLRNSLDMEHGGDIAANLDSLYEYMIRRLIEANRLNDLAILKEVSSLLVDIKEAWDAIPRQLSTNEMRQNLSGSFSSL